MTILKNGGGKTRETRLIIILFVLYIFVFSSSSSIIGAKQPIITNYNNLNLLKGIEIIDIDIPDIIIKSWSKFTVNITLRSHKLRASIVTIYVFLKTEGKILKTKQILVGYKRVGIAALEEEKTISIPCYTPKSDWGKWLLYKEKCMCDDLFSKGEVGIKIAPGFHRKYRPLFDRLFNNDFFVEWQCVKLVEPVILNPELHQVRFEWVKFDNETDEKGNFTAYVNISNKYYKDIPIFLLVYIVSESFISSKLFKHYQTIFYSGGFLKVNISGCSYNNTTINCSFPKENLMRQYYDVMILLFSYLPINQSINYYMEYMNRLDEQLTDTEEWRKLPSEVKNFWNKFCCNVPFALPIIPTVTFSKEYGIVFYQEKTQLQECVEEAIELAGEKVKQWMPIIYLSLLSLVGFACIGYYIVKKLLAKNVR